MARALISNGAKSVYVLGRDFTSLSESELTSSVVPIPCDVTSKTSLQAAVDQVLLHTDHVNLVIANAGVPGPLEGYNPDLSISELRKRMFDGVSMEDFNAAYHVNATGALFTMLAFLELLDAGNKKALQGGFGGPILGNGSVPAIQSQVIFNASVSGFTRSRWTAPAYAASKAAAIQMSQQAATMLAPYGIRVNCLCPGGM
jgi:NAD(P)-dependent dehydrogenase (short-subunit alcohol dehydrogenase family)